MIIKITESQAKKLFGEKIECKCGHSWVKEKDDKQPYLCHICGWDLKNKKYDDIRLFKLWKQKLN